MKYSMISLIFLISSIAWAAPPQATGSYPRGSIGGRFQIVQISDNRRDQFLIDTETGRMWTKVCSDNRAVDCNVWMWREEIIQDRMLSDSEASNLTHKKQTGFLKKMFNMNDDKKDSDAEIDNVR